MKKKNITPEDILNLRQNYFQKGNEEGSTMYEHPLLSDGENINESIRRQHLDKNPVRKGKGFIENGPRDGCKERFDLYSYRRI